VPSDLLNTYSCFIPFGILYRVPTYIIMLQLIQLLSLLDGPMVFDYFESRFNNYVIRWHFNRKSWLKLYEHLNIIYYKIGSQVGTVG